MTDYFVTTTRGFHEQEKAEEYASEQSTKTSAKYAVLVRDPEDGPSLTTVAVYEEGVKLPRVER